MLTHSASYFRYIRMMGLIGSPAGHADWCEARSEEA